MKDSIVFIAPNTHIAVLAQSAVSQLKLNIPVIEAYDYKAIEALRKFPSCHIAISRGGTANYLKGVKGLTVVDLTASFFDIQKSLNELIAKGCRKIAVVSQDNVIGPTPAEFAINDIEVELHPCSNTEEIMNTVNSCIKDGADGIVGCVVAIETARQYAVEISPVEVDFFSVKKGILQALELEKNLDNQERTIDRLESLLNNIEEGVVIFDSENTPILYNEYAGRIMRPEPIDRWYKVLENEINSSSDTSRVITLNQNKILIRVISLAHDSHEDKVVILQDSTAIEETAKNIKISSYEKGLYARHNFNDIIFSCPAMEDTVSLAKRFANSDSTVMIFGETGAGKEGFAQSIHNSSPRANKPFVSVNCASLPQGLVASELFGYVEGAFTGARRNGKKGLFELAQGGSIFLDEITEIPLEVQSQFLRVIQEREIMRIGDDRIIPLDIRIICATNKDILTLCEEGKFRYDLYYRLNVLSLSIPPLRERGDDIIIMFRAFIAEFCKKKPDDIFIDDDVQKMLLNYNWPGNVRELRNVAEALSFFGSEIKKQNVERILHRNITGMSANHNSSSSIFRDDLTMEELEKYYYKYMLARHNNTEIAKLAGISRSTLWKKLKQLELSN
ncbi:sigma 54-interacting transcriptional regulator [Succinivibrio dextrinosolvens]|uniref:Transcriptional regulator containing PAS, AAA-type ATPase, and DNA-binding Fis domains n=1 Tax=Succinivibrio dextrinosolvens TaxID=83771 RepID=A0A662ZCI8_9GAMM|nr:sigma 54-interacting transcriptional regulator [Succinivibrio dextrinosolvens]SFK45294.1 Transcriptional regulator containing PAS, AAA-type ATPase, and DNA-binding Fis domains [Succinivibrio dextrinosolvens]